MYLRKQIKCFRVTERSIYAAGQLDPALLEYIDLILQNTAVPKKC